MSFSELVSAVHSLPPPEKVRLIGILADDLSEMHRSSTELIEGECAIWSPLGAFDAGETLLAALEADSAR